MRFDVKQAYQDCHNSDTNILLDVRTPAEWQHGIPQGALCLELSDIEQLAESKLSKQHTYYVLCHTSQRSALAIEQLKNKGFINLYHVTDGYQSWHKQDLPIQIPTITNNDLRYQRHYQLKGFGRKAQDKLNKAHVLLIGAGGLGSSSALYLAAAGVGQITLVDDDVVSLSNLQRQILHTTNAIGSIKVESAQKQLSALNPEIKINSIAQRLDKDNAKDLIQHLDVVIDGSDNLKTRYLVNDICLKSKVPLVYAAVYQYEAQLTTFDFRKQDSPCLRCLFPQTQGFEPANCSTEGVLGVVPGLAGIMQATEAIKLISQVGEVLTEKLLIIDLLDNSFRTIKYSLDSQCKNH
jgi:molybdopterin/thiamine biosynthesis adenylyltransferase/rhodanese-related sulfurtransferase